jgi:hypothetical protein
MCTRKVGTYLNAEHQRVQAAVIYQGERIFGNVGRRRQQFAGNSKYTRRFTLTAGKP